MFFNVAGVVIWFGLIDQLAALVRFISPTVAGLQGIEKLAAETPRQIANAHSVFNIANTLLFLGFTTPVALLMQRLIPERPVTEPERVRLMYLDDILLETPEWALDRVRLELGWLGAHTLRMVHKAMPTVFHGSAQDLQELARMDDDVDTLYGGIVQYLGKLSQVKPAPVPIKTGSRLHDGGQLYRKHWGYD